MLPLFPFQAEDVQISLTRKHVFLGHDMGLGKTRIALETLDHRLRESKTKRALVCCPGGLTGVWQGEIEEWKPEFSTYIVKNRKDWNGIPESFKNDGRPHIVICSYEFTFEIPILAFLEKQKWPALVLEEAHHLSKATSKRTRACLLNLFPRADHAIFISGSIDRNQPTDIYLVAKTISPDVFPSYANFVSEYCTVDRDEKGYTVIRPGTKAQLEKLGRQLKKSFFIHRKKEDVDNQFPKNLRQVVRLESPIVDHWRDLQAAKDFAAQGDDLIIAGRQPPEGSEFQKQMQQFGQIKAPLVADYSKALFDEGARHQVIFCWYRSTLLALAAELEARGLSIITLMGGDRKKDEKRIDFQAGKANIFLSTFAGAEGITLTRANYCLMAELSFTLKDNQQAINRIHRIGQKETCFTKFCLLQNHIDDAIYNGFRSKAWAESKILSA